MILERGEVLMRKYISALGCNHFSLIGSVMPEKQSKLELGVMVELHDQTSISFRLLPMFLKIVSICEVFGLHVSLYRVSSFRYYCTLSKKIFIL